MLTLSASTDRGARGQEGASESLLRKDLGRRPRRKRRHPHPYESFLELDWKIGHWVPKSISDPTYALHGNCIIDDPPKEEILTFVRLDGARGGRRILLRKDTRLRARLLPILLSRVS
ncbi:hypothetical protein HN011_000547 [Eciton burchellii]|nr:hypothetical protein HN011_000547 [Eciton burchellii]